MNSDVIIECCGLSHCFGEVKALESVDLAVRRGEIHALIGPNGAGKSTAVACMAGLLSPSGGQVRILNRPMNDANAIELKRRIGTMPEDLALFDQLYAHELLTLQAGLFGLDRHTTELRVRELLSGLELADTGRRRLRDFSTGMRKKVAFAAAIIHNPTVIFLDEPFESIDPATVAMMRNLLSKLATGGRGIIITSHDLASVNTVCHSASLLVSGSVAWRGEVGGDRTFLWGGREYASLETLFLEIAGTRSVHWSWLDERVATGQQWR